MSWRETRKTYDKDFRVLEGVRDPKLALFSELDDFYSLLCSPRFTGEISGLAADQISRYCYSMISNVATWGTGLAPHVDSIRHDDSAGLFINVIYFLDSRGTPEAAGATSFYPTNTYDRPIFVPHSINNSLLIYRSGHELFHGFPPMKFGCRRRVVTAHFKPLALAPSEST